MRYALAQIERWRGSMIDFSGSHGEKEILLEFAQSSGVALQRCVQRGFYQEGLFIFEEL
jgi:hypothetical protein